MPLLQIRGVTVDFPFTPYDCQKEYMTKVIQCLQERENGILESPTGTGKTLCLLCATLAWRNHFKDAISARKIAEKTGGAELFPDRPLSSWGTSATDGDIPGYYTDIPKIIYASRTHSQLTQVVNELKNTAYWPKVCVLGSREQMCINPEVMRQESNHVKIHMCRNKVSTRTCPFYNNVDEKSTDKELVNSILDIEDLVKAGKKQRVCPYYLSRSLKQQADLIFMPYNYLLDPKSRRAHSIDLKGTVVIFDEAHNVEKMCEESTSFDLTPYDLASAIETVDKLLMEQAKEAVHGHASEDFNVDSLSSGLKLDIQTIAKIKQILLDLEGVLDSFAPEDGKGITKPGSFIYELFQKAHLTFDTKDAILEAVEQLVGYFAGQPGIFVNTSGLQKLAEIIQLVFCIDPPEGSEVFPVEKIAKQFKVHIHKDKSNQKKKQNADVWASSSKKQGNILSYWCFSPGFSMHELIRQGVRCVVLTSGTLSPLSSFTLEMQIPFKVTLENPHVIQRDQILVCVIDKGPDTVQLSSAFDRRFAVDNMASLGNTIVNLGRVIPHGMLVFFPSYTVMDKTMEFWRANGYANRIENIKPMFIEPKGKGTFVEIIDGYYNKVNDPDARGGSFFAVCRGKASEGLDFADTYGRGVVITGLPFPPKLDPRVILKMQYLDEMCRSAKAGVKVLSGQEWYRQQASRAVNQAIGRVIRHREDYGAIFLCDHRFKNKDALAQLPLWVRPYVRINEKFGNVVRDVAQFFRVAQKLRPPPVKKTPATLSGTTCSSQAGTSQASSCQSSQRSFPPHMPKAKVLDAHVPSLKRRRLDEPVSSDVGLCMQYEAEIENRQKRPAGLLDALDHSERRKDVDEVEFIVGVEKASRLSTLSLQYDKRMDDEMRGGKRKIKVIQEPSKGIFQSLPDESKSEKAKAFLLAVKESLSQMNFHRVMQALQKYKKADDLDQLLAEIAEIFAKDLNTHILLREFYQFIRPHHKKKFDEACQNMTGAGCGYKAEHSLSKEEREKLMQQKGKTVKPPVCSSSSTDSASVSKQLNSCVQLNNGGSHMSTHGLTRSTSVDCEGQGSSKSSQKSAINSTFLSSVQKALGEQKSRRFFSAVQEYKKTDDYNNMVTTVVSMLTEKNEDFHLLKTFSVFVRPHHKQRFLEMVTGLEGMNGISEEAYQRAVSDSTPVKTQSKISSFFSCTQQK